MSDHTKLRVASVADSAMDLGAMGGEFNVSRTYLITRDPSLVKEKPGQRVMWFHTRRLTEDEMDWVEQATTDAEKFRRAFRLGVTQIDNIRRTDGRAMDHFPQSGGHQYLPSGARVECWGDEELGMISRALKHEIGHVTYWRSFLAHESEPTYHQLPSSLSVLAARLSLPADANESQSAAQSSGSLANPGSPESSDSASGSSTDATVTANPT